MTPEEAFQHVNSTHRYQKEPPGRDHWLTPAEFDAAGQGDCEDFAIAYYFAVGGEAARATLAWCLIPESHMVCFVYDSEEAPLVLDVMADVPYRLGENRGMTVVVEFDETIQHVGRYFSTVNIAPWLDALERMGN